MGQVSPERIRQLNQHTNKEAVAKRKRSEQPSAKSKTANPRAELAQPKRRRVADRRPTDPKATLSRKSKPKPKEQKRPSPKVYPDWHWAWTHPYVMTAFAFGVGSNIAILHLADLLFGWPFHGASLLYDGVAAVCGCVLAAMCVHTYRDLPKYGQGSKLSID
jgi:hypothetical protein